MKRLGQRVLWVLWPAFLVAAAAEMVVFALIDPADLHVFGVPVEVGRVSVYTVGFFFLWAVACASSALTVFLAGSPVEKDRCPSEDAAGPAAGQTRAAGDGSGGAGGPATP